MLKIKIPFALVLLRFILGPCIIILSALHIDHYQVVAIVLLAAGLLTDICDGIIARQLHISTQKLRRLDSSVDQVFFISFAVATYLQCPDFFKSNAVKLIILFSVEGLTYLISFIKFKKEIATHTIGAKAWTLLLFATLVELIAHCESAILFNACFWVGLITRAEIIAIIFALKSWTNDVPSFYHSLQLRRGKDIRRNKMFNG